MTITMLDSISVSELVWAVQNGHRPNALAGYVAGNWVTLPAVEQLAATLTGMHVLSIAPFASVDADCLDVEAGDATPGQAPAWVRRQHARGVKRPVLYSSASQMGTVRAKILDAGIPRTEVRLWSAHYTGQPHICSPNSCAFPGCPPVDGTQWIDRGWGHNIDQSVLLDDFFTEIPPKPRPRKGLLPEDDMLDIPAGAAIPIAIPAGTKTLRFASNADPKTPAKFHIDWWSSDQNHNGTAAYGAIEEVSVPGGRGAVVHRDDTGTALLSMSFSG